MDIPKYIGVVFAPYEDKPTVEYVRHEGDEQAVTAATLVSYQVTVSAYREDGFEESFISQIGWDVYVSTRATANSPAAIHHGFNGPGA